MKTIHNLTCIIFIFFTNNAFANAAIPFKKSETAEILNYIEKSWTTLTRSMNDSNSLIDPKTHLNQTLYLPFDLPTPPAVKSLSHFVNIKRLPRKIHYLGEFNTDLIQPAGLLYLPNPYVVPGGMFNEMYGWDSYFIIRGLLESHHFQLAQGMIENFFFQLDHYGAILNANRTYYLTRSQPPFLSSMIRDFYQKNPSKDAKWLLKAYEYAAKDYYFWVKNPHLAGHTKLSRYYDFYHGPVPELDDSAKTYYSSIKAFFACHPVIGKTYLDKAGELNDRFYQGDRAMRESGYDTSFRFGLFSADTLQYAPVELNSLLYIAEKNLAWMSQELHLDQASRRWQKRASVRRHLMNQYFWNEKEGFYFDYDFKNKRQSRYLYASSFFPLWAGIADSQKAKRMLRKLSSFETQHGLVMSPYLTGAQWDYPYGWAPLHLIVVEGLHQYGFHDEAQRLAQKYLAMIMKNFKEDKTIHEKYDVVKGSSKSHISVGYKINVLGFGWTNGVFLVLLNQYSSS